MSTAEAAPLVLYVVLRERELPDECFEAFDSLKEALQWAHSGPVLKYVLASSHAQKQIPPTPNADEE